MAAVRDFLLKDLGLNENNQILERIKERYKLTVKGTFLFLLHFITSHVGN